MTALPAAVRDELDERERRTRERRAAGEPSVALRRVPLRVVVDGVRSLWNVGSIFRSADGCGVEHLHLTGITGTPPRAEIAKTALGAEQAVAWSYRADPLEVLDALVRDGYTPVALEATERAEAVDRFAWPSRVLLVVGNEVAGVSAALLERCPAHVSIPMLGEKRSFNVAVAFGIAAHAASRALIQSKA